MNLFPFDFFGVKSLFKAPELNPYSNHPTGIPV
jgi:hypothetical protein